MGEPNDLKIADGSPAASQDPTEVLLQLRDSKAKLAAAQRLAGVREWSYDLASHCLQWSGEAGGNPADSRLEGADLSLPRILERIHPQDRSGVETLAREVLYGERPTFTFRFRWLTAEGQHRLVKGEGEAVADPDGQIQRVAGCFMDVKESQNTPPPRNDADPHVSAAEASSSVWFWEQDQEFRFTGFTQTYDNNFRDNYLGKRRWELSGAAPCSGTWDDHVQVVRQRRAFHDFGYCVGRNSSDERVFSTSGVPRYTAQGDFAGYLGVTSEITAQKKAQQAASQSRALLQLASRLGQVGAWAVDLAGMQSTWSSELLALYEFEPAEHVTPAVLNSLAFAQYRGALTGALRECSTRGTPVDIEFQSLTAKGRQLWLHLRAEAVLDGAGGVICVQGAVQDISERKRDAERLGQLNRQLTTTFESITDAFVTVDRQFRFTYVNIQAERRTGLSRADLLGRPVAERFPAFEHSEFRREFERALAEGTAGSVEAYAPTLERWLSVAVFPSEQGLALYIRNVTDSRKAQQELVLSEERYRLLFETSADAILKVHPDGRILRANRTACEMFGRTEAQMQEMLSKQLGAPADYRLELMIQQRLRHGSARGELTLLRSDGSTFEGEVNTSTLTRADGQTFVNIVIRDATERIQLRQKLIALNEELADKVRERTRELERTNSELAGFARSLAHDLRQPVTAAKTLGLALQIFLTKEDTQRTRQYVGQVNESIQWIDSYVEAMLSLTKISRAALVVEDVDLSGLAVTLIEELQRQYPSRKVDVSVQAGLQARGDRTLLRLLLQNLLGNAWKFTGRQEGARISFSAARASDDEVVYSVQDNGAGFDIGRADRLFETFQRFHKSSEFAGTGIGLANAHKIVQRHGGRIWAESEPGWGARFFFTLAGAVGDRAPVASDEAGASSCP